MRAHHFLHDCPVKERITHSFDFLIIFMPLSNNGNHIPRLGMSYAVFDSLSPVRNLNKIPSGLLDRKSVV